MGACPAIDGYSLEASRRTVRELGFPVVKIQCIGEIVARPGKYPGFQFDQLTAAQKKQISGELRGFRRVTAHLPYTGLNYMHADPAQRASVRTLEVAMEGAGHFGARVAVLHPSRFLPTKWGPVGTSISTASASGVHPQVGATINVGHQKTYEELVARIKPEQRGTPEGIRAYNDTTLDIIERLGRRGHFFTVPLAVGHEQPGNVP